LGSLGGWGGGGDGFRIEYEFEVQREAAIGLIHPIGHERAAHAEHGIGLELRIAVAEDVRDQGLVALSFEAS